MKRFLRIFAFALAIAAVFASLSACTIQPGYEGAPEGWRPVNEGDEGAILYVPIEWSVETSTGVPTAYYSSNDRSSVTLTTVSKETAGELDAKSYFESYIDTFKASITDFKFVKDKEEDPNYTNRLIAGVGATVYTYSGKVAGLDYKFRQALLKNPENGCIYIITYSASDMLYSKHIEELDKIYDNFRFVTESIPMKDTVRPTAPDSEGIEIPDGMKLVSSNYTDYLFFVQKDWVATVTTGMTSAHAPEAYTKNISCTVFTAELETLDEYWTGYESDIKNTFGNMTYENEETKFTESKLGGVNARTYTYSVTVSGKTVYYTQHIAVFNGQIYIVTAASDSYNSARDIKFEFKFKQ